MGPSRLPVLLVLLVLLVLVACGGASRDLDRFQFVVRTTEHLRRLPNGARVVFVPDESTNLVHVLVRIQVGAKDDPLGDAGLAHLAEHLLFEGRPDGPGHPTLGAQLAASSVHDNAFTLWDATDYVTVAAADRLGRILELEARRLDDGCRGLDDRTLRREREIVKNELLLRRSDARERVVRAVYPLGHPYARAVGDGRELDDVTVESVCRFVADHYVPERATMMITGGVSAAQVEDALVPLLALPARGGEPLVPVAPLEKPDETFAIVAVPPVLGPAVVVAWPMPRLGTPDALVAALAIDELLARLPHAAGSLVGGLEAQSFILVVPVLARLSHEQTFKEIVRAAAGVRERLGGLPLEFVWARLLAMISRTMDSPEERARYYADRIQMAPDAAAFEDDMARIETLDTVPALAAALDRFLGLERVRVLALVPSADLQAGGAAAAGPAGEETHEEESFVNPDEASRPLDVPPPARPAPRGRDFVLPGGLRVLLLPEHVPYPVVTVSLGFTAGAAAEPADAAGVATLAAASLVPPTGIRNTRGMTVILESDLAFVGASFDRLVLSDATLFSSRGLGVHAPYIVKALARAVRDGSYGVDWRERGVGVFPPDWMAAPQRAAWRSLLGAGHPYTRDGLLANATLAPDDPVQLTAFRRAHYVAEQAIVVVAGNFDVGEVEAAVRDSYASWPRGQVAAPPPPPQPPSRRTVGLVAADAPLVGALVGFVSPPGIDEHYVAREVLAQMLDRRVRRRVREELGVAYAAGARLDPRRGPGMLAMRAELDPARAGEGLAAMREALASLRRGEGFDADFARARRQMLRDYFVVGGASTEAVLSAIRFMSMGADARSARSVTQQLSRLRAEDVRRVLDGELQLEREVVVLRGRREAIEKAAARAGLRGLEIVEE